MWLCNHRQLKTPIACRRGKEEQTLPIFLYCIILIYTYYIVGLDYLSVESSCSAQKIKYASLTFVLQHRTRKHNYYSRYQLPTNLPMYITTNHNNIIPVRLLYAIYENITIYVVE